MNDDIRTIKEALEWARVLITEANEDIDGLWEDLVNGVETSIPGSLRLVRGREMRNKWLSDFPVSQALTALGRVEMAGWQPIETAPKDGSRVLSCRPPIYAIVAFQNGEWHMQGLTGGSLGVGYYPTHWMPLPTAPISGTAEGGGRCVVRKSGAIV